LDTEAKENSWEKVEINSHDSGLGDLGRREAEKEKAALKGGFLNLKGDWIILREEFAFQSPAHP